MQADPAMLASGARFEERYEILGQLGSGSFARVYEARQLSTGKSVALKLLSAREGSESSTGREVERFRREAKIGATLSHPNIVELIDVGETGTGQLYAVFAYVPGENLEQALAREGALGVRESVRLMTQVLEALEYAHVKGVVHRDLKPSNLMLSGTAPRRHAVVLDFGLGGLAEGRRRKEWQTLTQTREFLGTPLYASPEQLAGEAATERSDLYAWGLVFLECLTGRHPFVEAGAAERLLTGGGAVEIPVWLRGHRLGDLLERVTARDAAKRDGSIESLLEALDAIARGELPKAPEAVRAPAPLAEQGERRHLTVLFCDLVGSSALGQRLETEAYRRLVQAYHARATEAIARYEGHVAQYLGDGLLVYFGHPQAHEDDAERAVRAGREILRELEVLNPRLEAEHGERLQVRIGIHTGPAVVGEMGRGEARQTLALGDTLNVAARLEGFAEPDTVVISEATRRLVAGLFVTEDRGTPELKGISEPTRAHRVLHPSGVVSRLDRAPALTPFVGREQELGLLFERFAQVEESQGQAVLIGGEAGIGKSRLVYELRERLRAHPHSWLEGRCSPYTQNSALHPVIAMLEEALDFREEDAGEQRLARLERGLAHAGLEPAEAVPLLASLLSLRLPERYAPLEISPQRQREKTLEALLAWLLALGEKQPVVLLVEDLHWADPSTLEWLGLLIEQCATACVLLLLTHRPEFEPPWPRRGHVLPIALSRLSRSQARELIAGTAAGSALADSLCDTIAARSDGIPLFVEELAKGTVEAGGARAGPVSQLEIPETLHDSLMARLDRLGEAKAVAQVGAVVGREFPYALLEAVAPMKEPALREGLGRLVEAELAYQRGLPPRATYTFKHALVQDAAYASLLEGQRRELHRRIADALEQRFPERVEGEPELIARHCEEAGRTQPAIGHFRRAAERAMQRSAQAEAIGHLHRAIELLHTLPESTERNERELQLQIALGAPLIAAKGYDHPEAERAHERARELCQRVGDRSELLRPLIGLSVFHFSRGELRAAYELAAQALALAEQSGESFPLLVAHTRVGVTHQYLGELPRALEHLEEAVRLYDPAEHRTLAAVWGQDWGIMARANAAMTLELLGHPDRARRLIRETTALARQGDPYSLVTVLISAATVHLNLREWERAREAAEEVIAIARERGFPFFIPMAIVMRCRTIGGSCEAEKIRQVMAALGTSGVYLPGLHGCLAGVYQELGQTEDALAALEVAFATGGEARRHDAYLQRLKGEILLQPDAREEAERCLRRALEIAQDQEARWYGLQAATSLARLLRDQDRRDEARALLQPVYDWFTEGFDTADLKEAKALLEEL